MYSVTALRRSGRGSTAAIRRGDDKVNVPNLHITEIKISVAIKPGFIVVTHNDLLTAVSYLLRTTPTSIHTDVCQITYFTFIAIFW